MLTPCADLKLMKWMSGSISESSTCILVQENLRKYKELVCVFWPNFLNLLHSERPKLHTILAFLSAIGLNLELILNEFTLCSIEDLCE